MRGLRDEGEPARGCLSVPDYDRGPPVLSHELVICPGPGLHVHGNGGRRCDCQGKRGPLYLRGWRALGRESREPGSVEEEEDIDGLGRAHEESRETHIRVANAVKRRIRFPLYTRRRTPLLPVYAAEYCVRESDRAVQSGSAQLPALLQTPGVPILELDGILITYDQGPLTTGLELDPCISESALEYGAKSGRPLECRTPPSIVILPPFTGSRCEPPAHSDVNPATDAKPSNDPTRCPRRAEFQCVRTLPAQGQIGAQRGSGRHGPELDRGGMGLQEAASPL